MTSRKIILALNSGSSSLKISLYECLSVADEPVQLLLTSSISSITAPPAKFSFNSSISSECGTVLTGEPVESIKDHITAFSHFLAHLKKESELDPAEITYVCHRVVHGGDYSDPIIISEETYHHIEKLSDLAPLHNGAALSVIKACIEILPNAPSVAFFDTAFHRSIPEHISTYAINQSIAKERGLKKYGFHGLSYAFILRAVSRFLQKPTTSLNLIVLHLGSGASACAIKNGRSLDTSMGLTPLTGLPGATRSGAVDPSLIFHYTNTAFKISHSRTAAVQLHVTEAEDILNTKSGWQSLTGTTDFGVITSNADLASPSSSNNVNRLAFDLFTDRILTYVGSYYLKLDGQVDALVFAAGIGERSKELREAIGRKVKCLGFTGVDSEKNAAVDGKDGIVIDVSAPVTTGVDGEARAKGILVCMTDEQLEMARECVFEKTLWQ